MKLKDVFGPGHFRRFAGLAIAWFSMFGTVLPTRAELVVSSLSNQPIDTVYFRFGAWIASPFTTDARARQLSSVVLKLQGNFGIARVFLFEDNAGHPGAPVADLGAQTLTNGQSLWPFRPSGQVVLRPSTTYWAAIGNVATNDLVGVGLLLDSTNFTFTGVPGASMTNFAAADFSPTTNPPATFNSFGTNATLPFEVNAIAAPTLTLILNPDHTTTIVSTGGVNYPHLIQATTNLVPPVIWVPVGSNVFSAGAWTITDPDASSFNNRFYRSVSP